MTAIQFKGLYVFREGLGNCDEIDRAGRFEGNEQQKAAAYILN